MVALLATPGDFEVMRQYRSFPYDSYDRYLVEMQRLLDSLSRNSAVCVTLLDPQAFAAFCGRADVEPDSATSRARYAVESAIHDVDLLYSGAEVVDVIADLMEELETRIVRERATRILEAASPDDVSSGELMARTSWGLYEILDALGPGHHHLVCSVPDGVDRPLVATLHAVCVADGNHQLPEADAFTFCLLMASGLRIGRGGITARTTAEGETSRECVRGWAIRGDWLWPLTAAQIFAAYCTDAESGEPIPPEHGVEYLAGLPIEPPER